MELRSEMDIRIAEKMLCFPPLGQKMEGTWNLVLTNEFHMTNDSHLFKTSPGPGRLPLWEGKMFHQFNHLWGEPKYWVNEKEAAKELLSALEAYRTMAPKTGDQELAALVAGGESQTVEFKAAARWDVHQNKANKEIERVIVKTVAAFLNSDGGTLLIGVDDEAKIVGLENDFKTLDRKPNADGYENFLMTLLTEPCGKEISSLLRIHFHKINGRDVCRVAVKSSPKPIFVRDASAEHLYIRAGNSTRLLTTREAVEYCKLHWAGGN